MTKTFFIKFSTDEITSLALAIVAEVYNIFNNEQDAQLNSPVYRLFTSFQQKKRKLKYDFYHWLYYIHKFYISNENTQPDFTSKVTKLHDST